MTIFSLVIILFVIYMTMNVAWTRGKSETINKKRIADDFVMMVDTLIATPNEVIIEYPYNLTDYIIIINQNQVTVFQEGDIDIRKRTRTFFPPPQHTIIGSVKNIPHACLEKNINPIDYHQVSISLRSCTLTETRGQPDEQES